MSERTVMLKRPAVGGFGFSITGGHPSPIVVSKITPGSPASASPDVKVGDQLVRLNGKALAGMSQMQVVNIVKQAKGELELTIADMKADRKTFTSGVPAALASQIDGIVARVTKAAAGMGLTVGAATGGTYAERLRSVVEQLEGAADTFEGGLLGRLAAVVARLEAAADARGAPAVQPAGSGPALPRLAAAVARLESASGSPGAGAGASAGSLSANPTGSADGDFSLLPSVLAFDEILVGPLKTFLSLSTAIGGDVAEMGQLLQKTFIAQRRFLEVAPQSQKPGPKVLPLLIEATSEGINAAMEFRESKRTSKQFNHLSAVAEAMPALGWIVVEPKPVPFIKETADAGQFYSNRVIKEFKESSPQDVEWARTLNSLFAALAGYVKAHHTTGVVWGKKMRSMTFWSNAIASTAPGDGDADRYIFNTKLGAPTTA